MRKYKNEVMTWHVIIAGIRNRYSMFANRHRPLWWTFIVCYLENSFLFLSYSILLTAVVGFSPLKTRSMFSSDNSSIFLLVSAEALPIWGVRHTLGNLKSSGWIEWGSCSNTSSPAPRTTNQNQNQNQNQTRSTRIKHKFGFSTANKQTK
jgi:hypothetical protein